MSAVSLIKNLLIQSSLLSCQGNKSPAYISVGFINPGSPMDPLPYKTRPSRRRSDNTRLGRPRYTVTGQDHDPVPVQHLRPGDLVEAPTRRHGRGGTAVRLRPPFSDREYARTSARCSFSTYTLSFSMTCKAIPSTIKGMRSLLPGGSKD